jgi:hypothetical protein
MFLPYRETPCVPYLKPGTLRGIIRQAGFTVEEFVALL